MIKNQEMIILELYQNVLKYGDKNLKIINNNNQLNLENSIINYYRLKLYYHHNLNSFHQMYQVTSYNINIGIYQLIIIINLNQATKTKQTQQQIRK